MCVHAHTLFFIGCTIIIHDVSIALKQVSLKASVKMLKKNCSFELKPDFIGHIEAGAYQLDIS
jgi:hypothetical protein